MSTKNKPVLLIDVDGVLTSLNDIPIRTILDAAHTVAVRRGIGEEKYQKQTSKSKHKNEPGLFNSIFRIVDRNIEEYNNFCNEMTELIDYTKLKRNDNLYKLLEKASHSYNLYIATNNHRTHVKKVVENVFGKDIDKDKLCFNIIDITSTLRNDCFHPKQSVGGLAVYAEIAGADPRDCTLLDDSALNIDMATEIGMKGVEITPYYSISTYLREILSQ